MDVTPGSTEGCGTVQGSPPGPTEVKTMGVIRVKNVTKINHQVTLPPLNV